ncbi:CRISPR-associated endoribonuclease Cas6 [Clostridium chrysemydis]|uniref:CRISPR-associated endoribonuclease Cas6 n=1 Tax=Clostridium chrysemydis TaxID=2665504 RepID=UPI003F392BCF
MKVIELSVKVYASRNIKIEEAQIKISDLLNQTLAKNKEYLELHNKNKFKNYVYDSLYPISKNKVYESDKIYTFKIRTIDSKLSNYFLKELENNYTNTLKVLKVDIKIIPKYHLEKIYSITSVIEKYENGYWKNFFTVDQYIDRLKINLVKKYNSFTGEKITEDFQLFKSIEILNKKPIAVKYKDITLLGDKLELYISDDEVTQKLAYMSLATGIGEMNSSIGAGFVNYKFI